MCFSPFKDFKGVGRPMQFCCKPSLRKIHVGEGRGGGVGGGVKFGTIYKTP